MKNLFLILMILATFALVYYIMTKVDNFIEENQRLIAAENQKGQYQIRIAAENPMLLDCVASALESCSNANPQIEFFRSSGRANRLLEKLLNEQIDILLLSEEHAEPLDRQYESVLISCQRATVQANTPGRPAENLDEEVRIKVVWKKGLQSKNRDRVIFALENEHGRLKHGYADYLD